MSTRLVSFLGLGVVSLTLYGTLAIAGPPTPQQCFEDSEVILEAGVVDAITADVDGDGSDDLLALQPPMLNILRNDGENFQPYQSIHVGEGVTKIAAGYINKDAAPDIAILRGDELVIYINSGSGYPVKPTNVIPTAAGPVDLLFADLDDDGDDDVVTTHTAIGQVNGILLTPSGQLQSTTAIFNQVGVKKTAVGEMNDDKLPDLVVIYDDGSSVLLNRQSHFFEAMPVSFPQSIHFKTYEIVTGDFAGGPLDEAILIFAARIAGEPRLAYAYRISLTDDETLDYVLSIIYQDYSDHSGIAAVDQDEDGDLDIWLGGQSGSAVPIFLLEYDHGGFMRTAGADAFYSPAAILPISMNDKRNLCVLDSGRVKLLRSQFGAVMHTLSYELLPDPYYYPGIAAGDLNRDGFDDIVLFARDNIVVQWGGKRRPWQPEIIIPGSHRLGRVVDFNGDGLLDIVGFGISFRVYLQQTDGSFHLGYQIDDGRINALGDINGDGRMDAATSTECGVYLQQPDESFNLYTESCGAYGCNYGTILADMNGDQRDDFVRVFGVCLSLGDGTFGPMIGFDFSNTVFPSPGAVGDLDNDGDLDYLLDNEFCCDPMAGFYVYENDGLGNLTRIATPVGFGPYGSVGVSVTLKDIDGDGVRDFLHGSGWEGGVWYHRGHGDGTMTGVQGWACGYMGYIGLHATGDFDGDGAIDAAGAGIDSDWSPLNYVARVYGTCVVNCREDINHDDRVNVVDLFQLLKDWGHCPSCFTDLDGDDFVGRGDLDHLFDAWGNCEN